MKIKRKHDCPHCACVMLPRGKQFIRAVCVKNGKSRAWRLPDGKMVSEILVGANVLLYAKDYQLGTYFEDAIPPGYELNYVTQLLRKIR